eukprot:2775030-Rhodomonas_salina.5
MAMAEPTMPSVDIGVLKMMHDTTMITTRFRVFATECVIGDTLARAMKETWDRHTLCQIVRSDGDRAAQAYLVVEVEEEAGREDVLVDVLGHGALLEGSVPRLLHLRGLEAEHEGEGREHRDDVDNTVLPHRCTHVSTCDGIQAHA